MSTTERNEHEEIERALAWYVNGSLEGSERRRVADHLDGCSDCRQQLSALQALRGEVKTAGTRESGPSPDLFTRTLARIEREAPRRRQDRAWLAWWHATPAAAQWALAAQLLLLIGLATALLLPVGGEQVVTAGSGPSADVPGGAGPRLQVGFSPNASEPAIRQALLALEAEIVAGPSVLGLYTLELAPGPDDSGTVEAALARLRALPELVEYAEPLTRPDGR